MHVETKILILSDKLSMARLATVLLLTSVISCSFSDYPDFNQPYAVIADPRLSHPSDIVKFKGRYVATELYNDRLVIFDDLELNGLEYFDPRKINKQFHSPHFLTVTRWDTLLISNGWGSSIVEMVDLAGNGWKEFTGIGKKFQAPHGICVDDEGWIYVGDSLNSRLVRFRDMTGRGWQVFRDINQRISYIRELVCRKSIVWVANSYENKPGLNPGVGSNVLKISDFESGVAEIVFSFPDANMTGAMPFNDTHLLLGLWGQRNHLAEVDTHEQTAIMYQRLSLGTPYGTYLDRDTKKVFVAHIGKLGNSNKADLGDIAVYRK